MSDELKAANDLIDEITRRRAWTDDLETRLRPPLAKALRSLQAAIRDCEAMVAMLDEVPPADAAAAAEREGGVTWETELHNLAYDLNGALWALNYARSGIDGIMPAGWDDPHTPAAQPDVPFTVGR
jgi:hypothetical protein